MKSLVEFKSIEQLQKWLNSKEIDYSQWGKDNTKTIQNLWTEICQGESLIQDFPPLRIIQVVQILIRRGGKILVEDKQDLGNDGHRYRGMPPSEKIKPGENMMNAAIRGIEEELQVKRKDITKVLSSIKEKKETRESNSYPGLNTRYIIYEVEAEINNLPEQDFWTSESIDNHTDPVTRHQWKWVREGEAI